MPIAPAPPAFLGAPTGVERRPIRDRGDRADRCPGALRLYDAADGAVARVRLAGQPLSREQLLGIADLAVEHGNTVLELTSRANLQIRGLSPEDGTVLAARLHALGLLPSETHERVRNIVVAPFATAHSLAVAAALDAAICASPALAALSGRFLFAVTDGGEERRARRTEPACRDLGDVAPDIVVDCADDVPAAVRLATVFLEVTAELSPRPWQVAELDTCALSRLRELAGSATGLLGAGAPLPSPPNPTWRRPGLSTIGGEVVAQALAPLGRTDAFGLRVLADVVGAAGARVTPWRSVVLPGLSTDAAASALSALGDAGWVCEPAHPLVGHTACTGRPGCARSRSDVHADALALAARTRTPTHWSGCERRCGHPARSFVDLVATGDGAYDDTVCGHSVAEAP